MAGQHAEGFGLCGLKVDEVKEQRNSRSSSTAEQERQCRLAEKMEVSLYVCVHI